MTLDNIDYIDRDYGHCAKAGKPRLIKARMSSFRSIADRFNKFRISQLEKKLEKMKDDALEGKYTTENFSKKLEKKSKAIAKLEEKILVLAKENVPTDYVNKRAIKLKKAMISNLRFNSGNFYSIGLKNKDEIFEDEAFTEVSTDLDALDAELRNGSGPFVNVDGLHDGDEAEEEHGLPEVEVVNLSDRDDDIEVVPSDITRQTIADVVNAEFDGMNNNMPLTNNNDDEIEEYTDNGTLNASSDGEMSKEEVRAAIEKAFKEVDHVNSDSTNSEFSTDSYDDDAITRRVDDVIDKIRVSRNNTNVINAEKFDENGDIRPKKNDKYHYVPMTDEEIRESQRKLGFDEHGNLISAVNASAFGVSVPKVSLEDVFVPKSTESSYSDTPLRDSPIVVEDRKNAFAFDLEDGENMFDVIDTDANSKKTGTTNENDLVEYSFVDSEHNGKGDTAASKLDEYHSLKDKILELQERRQDSLRKKENAEKVAEEKAVQAKKVKEMFEESQKNYEQSLSRLRAYTESLEEECARNSKVAEIAENDAQMSENFIAMQRQKVDDNNRVINEIDSLINGDTEAVYSGRAK